MSDDEKKSLMRSLGEFFGHIAQGIKTDPTKKEVRRTVEEETRPDGVILRRTTIEEVELKRGARKTKESGFRSQESGDSDAEP
ncbi:MAG: hypothetical protein JNM94_09035 [Phycisphaerae bacterium]|nr:hypothetical protein [Phycisphaerae bacterium]